MSHGCYADSYGYVDSYHNISSFEGKYLEQLSCPNGFNARTLDKVSSNHSLPYPYENVTYANFTIHREMQVLRCQAVNGSFSLKFRGKTTAAIGSNASVSSLRTFLNDIHTVGEVDLLATYPDGHICHEAVRMEMFCSLLVFFLNDAELFADYPATILLVLFLIGARVLLFK